MPAGAIVRKISTNGTFGFKNVTYLVSPARAFEQVLIAEETDRIIVTDLNGDVLVEHATGTRHPIRRQRKTPGPRPKNARTSPMS